MEGAGERGRGGSNGPGSGTAYVRAMQGIYCSMAATAAAQASSRKCMYIYEGAYAEGVKTNARHRGDIEEGRAVRVFAIRPANDHACLRRVVGVDVLRPEAMYRPLVSLFVHIEPCPYKVADDVMDGATTITTTIRM